MIDNYHLKRIELQSKADFNRKHFPLVCKKYLRQIAELERDYYGIDYEECYVSLLAEYGLKR